MQPIHELSVFTISLLFSVVFIVFGLNSLLLYLVLRKRVFLCYALLVFGLGAHVSLPIFRESNYDFFCGISIITAMVTTIGSLWFIQAFIGISSNRYRKWNRVYQMVSASALLIILIQLVNLLFFFSCSFSASVSFAAALITLFSLLLNFAVSFALWNKERLARLYFYLNMPMIVSAIGYVVLWLLLQSGLEVETTVFTFCIYCGMTIQMVLFSVFIGYKIRDAEKEKLALERDINQKLKEEVERQTESLKQAFGEVEIQKSKLEELNATKNKLFSLVAHDLRSPINNLSSLLELTEHHDLDAETMKSFTAKTRSELSQSMMVMERLLYWSTKQMEGIKVQMEDIFLPDLVKEVLNELKIVAGEKHIEFQVTINHSNLVFDRDMLRVSLRNLISNAIKFSHDGGVIGIESDLAGEEISIRVRDEGLGMNPDWFARMQKEGKPDVKVGTKGEKGTGFGLLITKDFVEMNGGELICESGPGKGTTFTLRGVFK